MPRRRAADLRRDPQYSPEWDERQGFRVLVEGSSDLPHHNPTWSQLHSSFPVTRHGPADVWGGGHTRSKSEGGREGGEVIVRCVQFGDVCV